MQRHDARMLLDGIQLNCPISRCHMLLVRVYERTATAVPGNDEITQTAASIYLHEVFLAANFHKFSCRSSPTN